MQDIINNLKAFKVKLDQFGAFKNVNFLLDVGIQYTKIIDKKSRDGTKLVVNFEERKLLSLGLLAQIDSAGSANAV